MKFVLKLFKLFIVSSVAIRISLPRAPLDKDRQFAYNFYQVAVFIIIKESKHSMKIFTSNIDIIISLLDNLDALDISLQS